MVQTSYRDDVATVHAIGDIDLSGIQPLVGAIRDAIQHDGVRAVEVDLVSVDFLDSSGISSLIKGHRMADQAGVGYRVVGARGKVLSVLELTGVWEHLHGHRD